MIAAVAGLLYLDHWLEDSGAWSVRGLPLAVVFLPLIALAFIELGRMAAATGVLVLIRSGLFGSMAVATLPFWWQFAAGGQARPLRGFPPALVVLSLMVMLVFGEQMLRYRTSDAFRRIACTLLGIVYLGVGGAIILWMRVSLGVGVLVMFLAAVKFTDIGAYFTGSAIGRHKMIPWLSPGKSWEGLAGGIATGALAAVAVVWAPLGIDLALWKAGVFGAVVGAAGQFADLCESLLKRSVSVKDAGAVVPQFGGVLDILDSPLLAAPVAIILLEAML